MNRNRIPFHLALAVSFAAALCAPLASAQDSISKVNGSITVEADRHVGDVETVNGAIRIGDGARAADVETVNGGITLGNRVTAAGLETVNGGITFGDEVSLDSLTTVNGGIRGGRSARIAGGVETVSGSIFLDRGSEVGNDVQTVNGGIGLVGTRVAGDVRTSNGDVTIGAGSHVRGGLSVRKPSSSWFPININQRKPRIVIGPGAVVEGELVFERAVTLYVHDTARTGAITGAEAQRYSSDRPPQD